jgi:hypothetical protein
MAAGIRQRHGNRCTGGRCKCPYEASVFSSRDGKKIRKTFPTMAAVKAWRDLGRRWGRAAQSVAGTGTDDSCGGR